MHKRNETPVPWGALTLAESRVFRRLAPGPGGLCVVVSVCLCVVVVERPRVMDLPTVVLCGAPVAAAAIVASLTGGRACVCAVCALLSQMRRHSGLLRFAWIR